MSTNGKTRKQQLEEFEGLLHSLFPHEPTDGQKDLLFAFTRFLFSDKPNCTLLIRGYAGTGKTTTVGAIVNALKYTQYKPVLLAPTGRAAKVMSNYAKVPAYTIHKRIYMKKAQKGGGVSFTLAPNKMSHGLFIVDEASMIGSGSGVSEGNFTYRDLLEDLLQYTLMGHNCKLVLIGDSAQLPPVGEEESPALNQQYLRAAYDLTIAQRELTEVVRQAKESGILHNATKLRNQIRHRPDSFPIFDIYPYTDIVNLRGDELQDELETAYSNYDHSETVVITRSNKSANLYNQNIRQRILWREDRLSAGDLLMVVRNNYFWLDPDNKLANFIANGDTIEVLKIVRRTDNYDMDFADVMVQLIDYPDMPPFEVKIMLDTLEVETPNLPPEKMKLLYHAVSEDYMDLKDRKKIHKAVQEDKFYNALQVKFSYAVTCHKSQGGQWPVVFVDQGYMTDEMLNKEFLRWLYTAITRATTKLYLVNFIPNFFEQEES